MGRIYEEHRNGKGHPLSGPGKCGWPQNPDQGDRSSDEPIDACTRTDDSIRNQEDREDLAARMRCLDERELRVLESRFGLGGGSPSTLKQVGKDMGLTKEWIRVIEQRAIRKLGSARSAHDDFSGMAEVPA